MKSLVHLLCDVFADAEAWCSVSTINDRKTVIERVEHEGLSFLTITLPSFAKGLERALELGQATPSLFPSFRKKGCLPAFLQGFTERVFDSSNGTVLPQPDVTCLYFVRQICYLFHKVELGSSPERERQAFTGYVKCEEEVAMDSFKISPTQWGDFERVSSLLFGPVFAGVQQMLYDGELVPRHGPGATADGIRGNSKFIDKTWTERLEPIFPAREFLFSSDRHYFDSVEGHTRSVNFLDPGSEIPVKVISVPKTMKTPRIIAIEPTHMQYVQQSLLRSFTSLLESDDFWLNGLVGFTDQVPNRLLACKGSKDLTLATLDLSEASDRVSIQHVEHLLARYPLLREGVFACRSSKADVPGFGVLTLSKYASMGSALTFPLEAMVFATICFIGIEKMLSVPLTKKIVKNFLASVRVYGDDIIVPVEAARSVITELEDFGLRVNVGKSFYSGSFRESCGGDYFSGRDVTVTKLRRVFPTSQRHVSEIVSLVSFRNQCYRAGLWKTTESLDNYLKRFIPFPIVEEQSQALSRHSVLPPEGERECRELQRPLVRAAVVRSNLPRNPLGEHDALLKCFLMRGDSQLLAADDHLERAGRPNSVYIKIRWVSPV